MDGGLDRGAIGPYDVPIALDSPITADAQRSPDGGDAVTVDATVDGASSVDASID